MTTHSSWLDRLLGSSLALLLAAAAITLAVHLIESVLVALLTLLGLIAAVVAAIQIWRSRSRRW